MLTEQEIQNSQPNLETSKEIIRQAELELADTLETLKSIELKATKFLSIFITIVITSIGIIAKFHSVLEMEILVIITVISIALFTSSCLFAVL